MQGYPVSKTLAEKEAWKFAEENKIDLITIIPSLIAGPPLTPEIPSSINLAMSLITGKTEAFSFEYTHNHFEVNNQKPNAVEQTDDFQLHCPTFYRQRISH